MRVKLRIKLTDTTKLEQTMKVERVKIVQFVPYKAKRVLQEKILHRVEFKNKDKY